LKTDFLSLTRDNKHMNHGVLLAGGVAASMLSSALVPALGGGSIGTTSRRYSLDVSPTNTAFGIWGVIYTLLIASAVFAAREAVESRWVMLLAAAQFLTALWVPLFTAEQLVLACIVLIGSAVCATAALAAVRSTSAPSFSLERYVCVDAATGLFAGWLWCAAALSVAIVLKSRDVATPRAALVVLAAVVAVLAAAVRNPVMLAPVIWLLIMQKSHDAEAALAGVVAVGTLVALLVVR
jgi:hypothetical protein